VSDDMDPERMVHTDYRVVKSAFDVDTADAVDAAVVGDASVADGEKRNGDVPAYFDDDSMYDCDEAHKDIGAAGLKMLCDMEMNNG
jgi:hypothetical protein